MKKTWKWLAALAIGFLLLLCQPVIVLADNEYSIPEASFDVTINEDGSASIHETWRLDFEKGSFTRFYKDISHFSLPKDEIFSEISDVRVLIDGKECDFTEKPSARPEYCFNIDSSEPGATIQAFVKSRNTERTFEFFYTVKDIVKCVDNEYDLFVFRFIGAHFSQEVKKINVHITTPDAAAVDVLYKSAGRAKVAGNQVNISCKNYKGMYKVRLRMDGADIPGASAIRYADLSNKSDKDAKNEKIYEYLGMAAALFWIPLFAILIAIEAWKKKKILAQLKQEGMSPFYNAVTDLSMVLTSSELVCEVLTGAWIFPLHLAAMVSDGRIVKKTGEKGMVCLSLPTDYRYRRDSEADAYVYSVLEGYIPAGNSGISLEVLTELLTNNADQAQKVNAELRKLLHTSAKTKLSAKGRPTKKKVKWLETATAVAAKEQMIPSISTEELFNSFVSHANALYYQANQAHTAGDYSDDTLSEYYYWDMLYTHNENAHVTYAAAHSSSDSGGGCSSCSSCSSCGGGGAD